MHFDGVLLLEQPLDCAKLRLWADQIERRYDQIEATRSRTSLDAMSGGLPLREEFVPTASSLRLEAALGTAGVHAILSHLIDSGVGAAVVAALGAAALCDLDQAWVRRQYAPSHAPPLHAPHGWHQDGALRFDFAGSAVRPPPTDALLPMITCWFPLGACGDNAPGLEFVLQRPGDLIPVSNLTDAVVRRTFPAEAFWRPVLEAGDVLFFRGDMLHRTHVTAAMTRGRTSIELRFFPATQLPARLADDRCVPLG
jgi:hypothetical protein